MAVITSQHAEMQASLTSAREAIARHDATTAAAIGTLRRRHDAIVAQLEGAVRRESAIAEAARAERDQAIRSLDMVQQELAQARQDLQALRVPPGASQAAAPEPPKDDATVRFELLELDPL